MSVDEELRTSLTSLLRRYERGLLPADRAMEALASIIFDEDDPGLHYGLNDSEPRIYRDFRGQAWRATFTIQRTRYNRYFADSAHGGADQSKREALLFTTQVEAFEELTGLANRFRVRKNTRSGVPGVARINEKAQRSAFWVGYWTDPSSKKTRSKKFSIKVHGEESAKALAIEFREEGMREMMVKYTEMLERLESFTPS